MSNLPDVTDATFQSEVIETSGTVIVDFWAPWCGPCRALAPILDQIAAENRELKIVKVDLDENPGTAELLSVTSIPTLKVFVDGKLQKTIVGAKPKPQLLHELATFLA